MAKGATAALRKKKLAATDPLSRGTPGERARARESSTPHSPLSTPNSSFAPTDSAGKPLNLDFEKGTLEDWTATGDAFTGQPIEGDTVFPRRDDMHSRHQGRFWIGGFERHGDKPTGTLTSVPFKITHPYASFLVAGGPWPTTTVEIVLHEGGRRGDYVLYRVSGDESEELKRVVVDLRKNQGKQMFVRLVDRNTGHWGHINFDDFRFHDTPPKADRRTEPPKADTFAAKGLSPEDAAKAMTVPEGFKVTLFAGEPDIVQPIAFTIDDRGRLWVVEGMTYPVRRPEGQGRDRILIFEDTDGDGKFDKRTVFMEGLNLVSGIELGFGGVWIGAAPYLMYIPIDEKNDKPAGPPKILLDGWAYQDTHETLNAFTWGPDGWLYGCHGVFTHSRVGKPGTPDKERTPINAGVWRYHPTKHKFEVFAHGTSNPWGVDFDERGQCIITACVIPHLYHMVQGGRYLRQAGQHFNPYTYDDIKEICDHVHYVGPNPHGGNGRSDDAGGGHAHCGAMIYLGGTWPAEYHNQIFMGNVHGRRINVNKLERQGSGYVGKRAPDFLKANDSYAQFINMKYGPDGNVYVIDWYDANRCHLPQESAHDRSNGRIYKVSHQLPSNSEALKLEKPEDQAVLSKISQNPLGLKAISDLGLLTIARESPNQFFVRKSRRILQERYCPPEGTTSARDSANKSNGRLARSELALESNKQLSAVSRLLLEKTKAELLPNLLAFHAIHPITVESAIETLDGVKSAVDDAFRGWLIQLTSENHADAEQWIAKLAELAKTDPSSVVRLYLSSAAQRIAVEKRWDLVGNLLHHSEDLNDHNLPLMYWYAAEPLGGLDPKRAIKLAVDGKFDIITRFMAQRVGSAGTVAAIETIMEAIVSTNDPAKQRALLLGVRESLSGRRRFEMPPSWPAAFAKLKNADDEPTRATATALAVTFGDPAAFAKLREVVADAANDSKIREAALATLVGAKDAELSPLLPKLAADKQLTAAAIKAMAVYDDPSHAPAILAAYSSLSPAEKRDALNTLAARRRSAHQLLEAIAAKTVPSSDVTADIIRQLRFLNDPSLEKRLNEVWGTVRESPAEKSQLIAEYKRMLESKPKHAPDVPLGRAIFAKTCQQCHKLFGVGDTVGPELTGSNRVNLDYILSNIIDPSAIMAKEYQPTIFNMTDGRVVTGLIRQQTPAAFTVRSANETVVLPKNEVESTRLSDKSMMPDDQLKPMSEFEVRSLVAYLASPQQTPIRATADNVKAFFNGKDLSNWDGEMKYWSVDNGELVGKSPGMRHNQFLQNQLLVGDFKLKLEVKLVPNEGNSGVQFRSKRIEGTEMRGYQADIGKGWWGKLYEESGRGMLVNTGGEQWLKPNDWNTYEVQAVGDHVQIRLNGHQTVDFHDPKGDKSGHIAVQIHAGEPMEVRFRNIELELIGKSTTRP